MLVIRTGGFEHVAVLFTKLKTSGGMRQRPAHPRRFVDCFVRQFRALGQPLVRPTRTSSLLRRRLEAEAVSVWHVLDKVMGSYPGGGPPKPGGGANGIPGGMPGGRNPGGGPPGMPGGPPKPIGGGIPPTRVGSVNKKTKRMRQIHALGGIMPIPRPAGIPRPGPAGS
jgi:hypothetical protein